MAQHDSLVSLFQDIANAIRAKIGGSATIVADNFPDQIATVYTAGQTSAKVGTASAADVRSGKTFTNSSTIGGTGSLADSTTGTASSGTLVATKTPGTSIQYVNVSAGYTAARYWAISAISTETKSVTATTATQTVSATSGKYMTAVTVNPQAHSSTYNLKQVVANTKIDLTATHNYRYIAFYGYDYNLCNMTGAGTATIKMTCPWNGSGANFTYAYWKVPAKFYLRCFMFHGIDNRMHGFMDAGASTWHTRVDDSTWGFQLKNTATAQTTWNATNYGWYRGTYNGSKLYPNSTIYVATQATSTGTNTVKGIYGGYYVA